LKPDTDPVPSDPPAQLAQANQRIKKQKRHQGSTAEEDVDQGTAPDMPPLTVKAINNKRCVSR
jgi:hypothetical protein